LMFFLISDFNSIVFWGFWIETYWSEYMMTHVHLMYFARTARDTVFLWSVLLMIQEQRT
jgi:hypothetical protein